MLLNASRELHSTRPEGQLHCKERTIELQARNGGWPGSTWRENGKMS